MFGGRGKMDRTSTKTGHMKYFSPDTNMYAIVCIDFDHDLNPDKLWKCRNRKIVCSVRHDSVYLLERLKP